MSEKDMTKGERVETIGVLVFIYFLFGSLTGLAMGIGGVIPEDPAADLYIGVILLWPLFVIKYLAIGIYMVFAAGFGLLV